MYSLLRALAPPVMSISTIQVIVNEILSLCSVRVRFSLLFFPVPAEKSLYLHPNPSIPLATQRVFRSLATQRKIAITRACHGPDERSALKKSKGNNLFAHISPKTKIDFMSSILPRCAAGFAVVVVAFISISISDYVMCFSRRSLSAH